MTAGMRSVSIDASLANDLGSNHADQGGSAGMKLQGSKSICGEKDDVGSIYDTYTEGCKGEMKRWQAQTRRL